MVYCSRWGSRHSTVLFKYLGQSLETSRILRRERPAAVFVMTPPVFAALPAFWYAWRHHAHVVLDAHSAAFMHSRWRPLQWLQRALCRSALTTLVHNEHIAALVRGAGAHAILVPDVPVMFSRVERFERPNGLTIAVVCSFNDDEPLEAIFAAAARLPEVRFYITGQPRHLKTRLRAMMPANAVLTDFLSAPAYGGLLQDADAVMVLTTRDHTMLRGAYEAIYQGTPVILSDWPLLRQAFDEGAVHVHNDTDSIIRGVRTLAADPIQYRAGALRLRSRKLAGWEVTKQAIVSRLATPAP